MWISSIKSIVGCWNYRSYPLIPFQSHYPNSIEQFLWIFPHGKKTAYNPIVSLQGLPLLTRLSISFPIDLNRNNPNHHVLYCFGTKSASSANHSVNPHKVIPQVVITANKTVMKVSFVGAQKGFSHTGSKSDQLSLGMLVQIKIFDWSSTVEDEFLHGFR